MSKLVEVLFKVDAHMAEALDDDDKFLDRRLPAGLGRPHRISRHGESEGGTGLLYSVLARDLEAARQFEKEFLDALTATEQLVDLQVRTPRSVSEREWLAPPPARHVSGERGIALEAIRGERGGDGRHVRVVLIEAGWNPGHRSLPKRIVDHHLSARRRGRAGKAHGNWMLGVLCAAENGLTGIVPEAQVEVCVFPSNVGRTSVSSSGLIPKIERVVERAGAGDIVILAWEALKWQDQQMKAHSKPLGLEAWSYLRRQFDDAAERDVHVVCAAGNGESKLDTYLSNGSSGALVVGASSSTVDERLDFSNWGSCVDLHAWGENVATCTETGYTDTFNGTSSATAIVGGVVAVLSSHVRAHTGKIITPRQMHQLLRETGTRPIDGIGVQPNVAKALARLKEVEYDLERL